mmetsp:Transcript_24852/g.29302  ORF Transcript_24852/g.29302 Transcript_24852/m.29302 type:complete len:415 (-) Transcript_24852:409-1653(-)
MTNRSYSRGDMNTKRSKILVDQSRTDVKRSERRNIQGTYQRSKGNIRNITNHVFYHQPFTNPKDLLPNRALQYRSLNYGVNEVDSAKNFPGVKNVPIGATKKRRKGPRGGVATPFPMKLYQLLESKEHCATISWLPHGRGFILRKPQEFLEDVMPRYFRQSKLTSFQRQLNLYGFHRLTSGADKGGYYHERFLRGKPTLCEDMLRIRIKGKGSKSARNPETEPNFYTMCPIDDLSFPTEDHSLSIVKDKKFMNPMLCSRQESTSRNDTYKNKIDIQITDQDSSREIKKHLLSPVCVSSAPFFDTLPQHNQATHNYSNSLHSIKLMPSLTLSSPSETKSSGLVDDSDSLTFEGKGFHYIDRDSFPSNEEYRPVFPDYIFPNCSRPIANNVPSDTNIPYHDPLLAFEWPSIESELV